MRTLLYSGTYDWQCSWYATKLWLDKLEWTGAAAYRAEAFREWRVGGEGGGERAGEVKTVGPLTFATVRGAGHMMSVFFFSLSRAVVCLVLIFLRLGLYVPHDKPVEAQAMVSRWLAQREL